MKRPSFGHLPPCQHRRVDEIRNDFGRVIGGQCWSCLAVLWGYGRCHGCGADEARLTYIVDEHRYCRPQCRRTELERARSKPFSPPPGGAR